MPKRRLEMQPDHRPDTTPLDRELLAIATIYQGHVVDIDHRFFRIGTLLADQCGA
jgi:hypothetical protein